MQHKGRGRLWLKLSVGTYKSYEVHKLNIYKLKAVVFVAPDTSYLDAELVLDKMNQFHIS